MKSLLLVLLIALSPNLFAQTKEEIGRQWLKSITESPVKNLSGTWSLKYFATEGRTFYKEKVAEYVKMGFADAKRTAKDPISTEDSIKICKQLEASMKNALDITYSFSARTYTVTKNGVWDYGNVEYSTDLTEITLYADEGKGKSFRYKIEKVDANELILIPVNSFDKELGKMFFTKYK